MRVFSLITKILSELLDFALPLLPTDVVCMKTNIITSVVYVKQAMTSTLLLALVVIVFTPNNVKTISIFIVILH